MHFSSLVEHPLAQIALQYAIGRLPHAGRIGMAKAVTFGAHRREREEEKKIQNIAIRVFTNDRVITAFGLTTMAASPIVVHIGYKLLSKYKGQPKAKKTDQQMSQMRAKL